jgi:hypothetical protein
MSLSHVTVQSTEHELIPARDASLAAIQGSATGSNVRYYLTLKHWAPKKETNTAVIMLPNCPMFEVTL